MKQQLTTTMGKIVLLSACLVLMIGCNSPEDKAKALIKDSLNKLLHDFASYEPVEYGTLDSAYSRLDKDPSYIAARKKLSDYNKEIKRLVDERIPSNGVYSERKAKEEEVRVEKLIKLRDEINLYSETLNDSVINNFKSEFNGYRMRHSFRSKTLSGNMKLGETTFYFNREMTEITDVEDEEEKD